MKIISISGWKGGVSKTTSAVHIARYLSEKGSVILVDGDPNRSALSWAERGALPFQVVDQRGAMKWIQGKDFMVIDSPARPESEDLKEMAKGSDLIVLPVSPDVLSLEPTLKMSEELSGTPYRVLVAVVPPKPNVDGEQYRQEMEEAGIPVFKTTIRRTIQVPKAALQGKTLADMHNDIARLAWGEYQSLGKEIESLMR